MQEGSYVCFPAGTRVAHCFENPYDQECWLLAIGNKHRHEIAVYVDSGKMKLRALDLIVPCPEGDGLGYWEGETPGEPIER